MLSTHRSSGFTLIEALVALVIFSIGLLGLAALYSKSLVVSHGAYLRSLASIQAMDMAERIRGNWMLDHDAGQDYEGGAHDGVRIVTDICESSDATVNCEENSCVPADLRTWDLTQWCAANQILFAALFEGAAITYHEADDDYSIAIQWRERAIAESDDPIGTNLESTLFEYRMHR